MTVTCLIRYTPDPFKRGAFEAAERVIPGEEPTFLRPLRARHGNRTGEQGVGP